MVHHKPHHDCWLNCCNIVSSKYYHLICHLPGDLSRKVFNQTVLKVVGGKSQRLEWLDHGFYLEVPNGALPPWETAEVTVRVILDDQFQIPANSQLISALYWITSTKVFLKEVAVNIQHSAVTRSWEERSKFKFVIAKSSQPNRIRQREGTFEPDTQYGTIMLKQFSEIGIAAPAGMEIDCISLIFYKPIANTDDANYMFVVIPNLDLLVEVCLYNFYMYYSLTVFRV